MVLGYTSRNKILANCLNSFLNASVTVLHYQYKGTLYFRLLLKYIAQIYFAAALQGGFSFPPCLKPFFIFKTIIYAMLIYFEHMLCYIKKFPKHKFASLYCLTSDKLFSQYSVPYNGIYPCICHVIHLKQKPPL